MVKSVRGKRILITGTAAGLGRDIALVLAHKGANLVLWDLEEAGNAETARLCRDIGVEAEAMAVDLADGAAFAAAAEHVGDVWGVINNAGIVAGGDFLESTDRRNELTFKVNVFAHFKAAKHFLPAMIRNNDGVFVSVASVASYFGSPGLVDYASSKAASRVFIETLAQEVAMQAPNVHLACACPSAMKTALFAGFGEGNPLNFPMSTSDVARYIVDDLVEGGHANGVWPLPVKLSSWLKGIWPERVWQTLMWPQMKQLMSQHDMTQADKIFDKMQSKL